MPNINIRLRQAKNLAAKDLSKTSDPLVICTVNNKKSFKTEPIMMDCNPNWETHKKPIKHEFTVNFDKLTDVIQLQVEDYNIFSKNKPIGSCQIPLQFLEKSKPMEFTFDLRDTKQAIAGQLVVLLEAMDFGIVPSTTTVPMYPLPTQQPYSPPISVVQTQQPPQPQIQPQQPQLVGNLQRNDSSPTLAALRHGSFLTNNNTGVVGGQQSPIQQQPLQTSQSFIMQKTTMDQQQSSMMMGTGSNSVYGMPLPQQYVNNGMQQQQQQPLTHSNSFINYSQQQPPSMYNNSQQGVNIISPSANNNNNIGTQYTPPQQYNQQYNQGIVNSPGSISSPSNLQPMNNSSSYNLMNNCQLQGNVQAQQIQQNDNSISTPRKALPTLPVKQGSTSPQTIGQPTIDSQIPKPNELPQSNQWTGVVTDQYIDYVASQLPIPLSIPEYYQRFVKPFKI